MPTRHVASQRTAGPGCASAAGAPPIDPTHQGHELKDVLRQIKADRGNFDMDDSPLAVSQQQPQFGTSMPVAGAVNSITSGPDFRTVGLSVWQWMTSRQKVRVRATEDPWFPDGPRPLA
jgi:hypothetical protein